jgi:hypothetical protein
VRGIRRAALLTLDPGVRQGDDETDNLFNWFASGSEHNNYSLFIFHYSFVIGL